MVILSRCTKIAAPLRFFCLLGCVQVHESAELEDESVRPGDVLFSPADLSRQRNVLVQPGWRLALIDEWPRGKKKKQKLPSIVQFEVVPENQSGNFTLPWIPNTTFHAVRFADLVKPIGVGSDAKVKKKLASLLDKAIRSGQSHSDMMNHGDQIRKFLSKSFSGSCFDDSLTSLEPKWRAVFDVFMGNPRRMAWVVKHMLDDAYVNFDEVSLGDYRINDLGYDFRMHIWHDFASDFNISDVQPHVHTHKDTAFASAQIAGSLEHHLYRDGGEEFPEDGDFMPHLSRSSNSKTAELGQFPMRGDSVRLEAGTVYIFPTRFIHIVKRPLGNVSVSLEMRLPLHCAGNSPPVVNIKVPEWSTRPGDFMDMFAVRWRLIRRRVAAFFDRGLKGDLGLRSAQMELRPEEHGAYLRRPMEGSIVQMTRDRKKLIEAFRREPDGHAYDPRMDPMLGHKFKVIKVLPDGAASLADPSDGLGIGPAGVWFFPSSTFAAPDVDTAEQDEEL